VYQRLFVRLFYLSWQYHYAVFVDDQGEPSTWLKNNPMTYELKAIVDLPTGNYTWAVAIVDTTNDNQPGIQLAVNGDMTSTGWLKLMGVQIL